MYHECSLNHVQMVSMRLFVRRWHFKWTVSWDTGQREMCSGEGFWTRHVNSSNKIQTIFIGWVPLVEYPTIVAGSDKKTMSDRCEELHIKCLGPKPDKWKYSLSQFLCSFALNNRWKKSHAYYCIKKAPNGGWDWDDPWLC